MLAVTLPAHLFIPVSDGSAWSVVRVVVIQGASNVCSFSSHQQITPSEKKYQIDVTDM